VDAALLEFSRRQRRFGLLTRESEREHSAAGEPGT
jgi:hypothetical protein